jgi:hypothetical protein
MKYFILSLCLISSLLSSTSSFAAPILETEALGLAVNFQGVASEEVGDVISASCEEVDSVTYQCIFEYDLPMDYCWYGTFSSSVTYQLDNHGALEIVASKTDWQE